jgi:acyl carrier protein
LLLVRVHGRLQQLLRREVPLVELFEFPTIARLAAHLQSRIDKWINLESLRKPKVEGTPSLPLHPRPGLSTEHVAPRNEIERTIVQIWQGLLGIEPIGIHDNFFELGGHSLLAMQLLPQVREAFKVELPLQYLFEAQTIASLGELIETIRWAASDARAESNENRESGVI